MRTPDREPMSDQELIAFGNSERERREKAAPDEAAVKKIIAALDNRGAWVQPGRLRYIKQLPAEQPMILSETFAHNLDQLSRFLGRAIDKQSKQEISKSAR